MAAMPVEDFDDQKELLADERDLFAAALALGETSQEYSLELDSLVPVFTRGENWKEALNELRRCVGGGERVSCGGGLPWRLLAHLFSFLSTIRFASATSFHALRLLKKHMRHPDLPMRALAGRWRLLNSRILPLIEGYGDDRCVRGWPWPTRAALKELTSNVPRCLVSHT